MVAIKITTSTKIMQKLIGITIEIIIITIIIFIITKISEIIITTITMEKMRTTLKLVQM
jgi:hypothetical protein